MIIGLTGSFCSGKDTIGEYLVERKYFKHYSLSDEIRYELEKKKIEPTRETLIETGMRLRKLYGNTVLAKRVLLRCKGKGNYVLTSIRHPSEINELGKNKNFFLVYVDAPAKLRFERMTKRKRPGDPLTFRKFTELERKESQTKGPGQQLKKCSLLADVKFSNKGNNLKEFYKRIDIMLSDLKKKVI